MANRLRRVEGIVGARKGDGQVVEVGVRSGFEGQSLTVAIAGRLIRRSVGFASALIILRDKDSQRLGNAEINEREDELTDRCGAASLS